MKAGDFDSDDDGEEDDEQVQVALADSIDHNSIREDDSFPMSVDETSGCTKRKRDDNDELDDRVSNVKNDGQKRVRDAIAHDLCKDGEDSKCVEDEEELNVNEDKKTRKKTKVVNVRKNSDDNDVNQPGELEQAHNIDFEQKIIKTDMPERMLLRDYPITSVEEGSTDLVSESQWIYERAFKIKEPQTVEKIPNDLELIRQQNFVEKIRRTLEFIRNQNFDVPLISCYLKAYVEPELSEHHLWIVYKLDEEWTKLETFKKKAIGFFEEVKKYQSEKPNSTESIPENVRVLKDEDFERLRMVQSIEELRDVFSHLSLYYGQVLPAIMSTNDEDLSDLRNLNNVNVERYFKIAGAGIDKFLTECYGLTPMQLGENMHFKGQRYGVGQTTKRPINDAFEYRDKGDEVVPKFPTSLKVLEDANYMLAVQFATEPSVRQCARKSYFEDACIDVTPTEQGLEEIDENNDLYPMMLLKDKPVRELGEDQFLRLVVAEQDGLLTIVLHMPMKIEEATTTTYVDGITSLFTHHHCSREEHVKEWDAERKKVIELAFNQILLPQLEKELRVKLLNEAREFVVRACCQQLNNRLMVAPYKANFHDEGDWDPKDGIRIMGLSFNRDKAEVCVIGVDGECSDQIRLEHILRRPNTEKEMMDRVRDLNTLKDFIFRNKPHAIAVSAESREALILVEDLQTISAQLAEDEEYPPINVELVDNSLSKLIAKSTRVKTQFPKNRLLREAISIARSLQDPLSEHAQLVDTDEDIVNLILHPMQVHVAKKQLLEGLYLVFVKQTNQVGLDINRAIEHPRTANMLQFICGLGPRKADDLIKTLKQKKQRLENRSQLKTVCHMGPKVFNNCAGFIKIVTRGDGAESTVQVLDRSRIHPLTYERAKSLMKDMKKDDGLEDLDDYAERPEQIGCGNFTLDDICSELNDPYKDGRSSYHPPSPQDIFIMITKETPHTFKIGKLVLATVTGFQHRKPEREELDRVSPIRDQTTGLWQCPYCVQKDFTHRMQVVAHLDAGSCIGQAIGVSIRLQNGLLGYLPIKCLTDSEVTKPEERIRLGQQIRCSIAKINAERFSVDVVCKPSDVLDDTQAEVSKAEEDSKKLKHRQSSVPGKSPKSSSTYRDNKRSPSRNLRFRSRSPERDRDRSSRRRTSPVQHCSTASSTVSRPKSLSTYRDNKRSPSPKSRRSRSPERERDRSSRRYGSWKR